MGPRSEAYELRTNQFIFRFSPASSQCMMFTGTPRQTPQCAPHQWHTTPQDMLAGQPFRKPSKKLADPEEETCGAHNFSY